MGMSVSTDGAIALGEDVWLIDLPPHQVRFFGGAALSAGARSVIALKNAHYDEKAKKLSFNAEDATVLCIGTTTRTVVIGSEPRRAAALAHPAQTDIVYGPGDREFLRLVDEIMPQHMKVAARALLQKIRQQSPGDLKRGKSRNFSETPDNFWYVIVQPQVQHLQITVRGGLAHFSGVSSLQILDDRGNTRFKITSERDIDEALKLIFHAKRMK